MTQSKEKLLLHSCCAPCATYPLNLVCEKFDVTLFFYNPNIYPLSEYKKREKEIIVYGEKNKLPVIIGDYDLWDFEAAIAGKELLGERTDRCWACYGLRLERTAKKCHECDIPNFTTTLSLSPHKNAKMIFHYGKINAEKFGVRFLEIDFKKKDGFKISVQLSREAGLYRQNYCGCYYSYLEMQQRTRFFSHGEFLKD